MANLDSLNTPVNNLDKGELINRQRRLNFELDQFKQFKELKELKEMKELNEFKEMKNAKDENSNHTATLLNSSTDLLNQSQLNNVDSIVATTTNSPILTSNQLQPTTLSPSNDQIESINQSPYSSHNTIKQKDLNKIIWQKQLELGELSRTFGNSLYQQLVSQSERYEDALANELNSDKQLKNDDERLEKISICLKCHYTCRKCSGGGKSNQCTACYPDSQLELATSRCLFKDVISKMHEIEKLNASSSAWSNEAFDTRVQNWITIFSLILCLFFSMAFFYLLLFKRECSNRSLAELQQYNHIPSSTANEYRQTKQPPLESLNSELHNDKFKDTSSKKSSSIFIAFLRFFKFNRPASSDEKLNHQHLNNVKYNNIPLQIEVVNGNEIIDSNETSHDQIT